MRRTSVSIVVCTSVLMEYCAVIMADCARKSRRSRTNLETGASLSVARPRDISKSSAKAGLPDTLDKALFNTACSSADGVQTFRMLTLILGCSSGGCCAGCCWNATSLGLWKAMTRDRKMTEDFNTLGFYNDAASFLTSRGQSSKSALWPHSSG